MNLLRVIEVCAGIGGIALGFEMAGGFEHVAFVERDDYACKILTKHWPQVPQFRDIRDTSAWNLPPCDVLAGGIPCQPHSLAGKRGAGSDERDLWPEFFRLVCEIRPTYAVVENVAGLRSSDNGLFFARILADLAGTGYDAEWISLSADAVGAPHGRERVFVVAYPRSIGRQESQVYNPTTHQTVAAQPGEWFPEWTGGRLVCSTISRRVRMVPDPRAFRMDDGFSTELDKNRLRCLGNAVLPQCAAVIGAYIRQHYEANL